MKGNKANGKKDRSDAYKYEKPESVDSPVLRFRKKVLELAAGVLAAAVVVGTAAAVIAENEKKDDDNDPAAVAAAEYAAIVTTHNKDLLWFLHPILCRLCGMGSIDQRCQEMRRGSFWKNRYSLR